MSERLQQFSGFSNECFGRGCLISLQSVTNVQRLAFIYFCNHHPLTENMLYDMRKYDDAFFLLYTES